MTLAESIASSPAMRRLFAPSASLQAMLDAEAALAVAGSVIGLLPIQAANAIASACTSANFDLGPLVEDAALAGTIVVPLVQKLRNLVPEHAEFVHLGGTSQDIIDTALVLQLREAVKLLLADLAAMAQAAAVLAGQHAATPMPGRTLLQGALPTTFGLKAANWLTAIDESRAAIRHAALLALKPQCGGAAGTLDIPGTKSEAFLRAFATALELPMALPWHTSRAALLQLAAAIAGAVGYAGKIGTDIAQLMQPEIAEVSEPAAPGRGGSSAMAHKRNPTLSIAARAAAIRMPGFIASLAAAQDQEHERAAGAWQAEAAIWPALMLCASGGLAAMSEALSGLEIHPDRMLINLAKLPTAAPSPAISWLIAQALDSHKEFSPDGA